MNSRASTLLLGVLIGSALVAGALLIWRPWSPETGSDTDRSANVSAQGTNTVVELPQDLVEKRDTARNLQASGDWCASADAWAIVVGDLGDEPHWSHHRSEAAANLRITTAACRPPAPLVSQIEVAALEPEQRPDPISEQEVVAFYPEGKQIRSVSRLLMQGQGTNKQWVFKGQAHFIYEYRVAVETTVIENRGTAVVFEQYFRTVEQLRADSEHEIEFRQFDDPILELVWGQLEQQVLKNVPGYTVVRKAVQVGALVDPRGRRSLTWLHDQIQRMGKKLDDSDEIEMVSQLDKLAGLKIQIEYVTGLGVTSIKVLDGRKFDPGDLERLAHSSSLLSDWFVSRVADKQPGEKLTLSARDVAGMIRFSYDTQATGSIELIRQEDQSKTSVESNAPSNSPSNGDPLVNLRVSGGEITLSALIKGVHRSGHVRPVAGFVRYSPEKLLVREAQVNWQADTSWFTTDHLLFGTSKIRNLTCETRYEAEVP